VIVTAAPICADVGVNEVIVGTGMTVKTAVPVTVPPGVVTEILPVVAPVGTRALTVVALSTVKVDAAVPLKLTAVAPVRFFPVIVTSVPAEPDEGENVVMAGAATTVKLVALVAVPSGVPTVIGPVAAPAGTAVVMDVSELTVNEAAVPSNATEAALLKPVPVRVTPVPTAPSDGEKDESVGGGYTVKLVALTPVPTGVVTEIRPVTAPAGTVAVIDVAEAVWKVAAAVPPKATDVAPVKLVPEMVTTVPSGPEAGVNEAMPGSVSR
jgi:hypothetical protein